MIALCTIIAYVIIGIGCDKSDTLSFDQLIAKGRQYYADGKIDDAVELFKKALIIKPDNGALHYELGVMYYEGCQKSYNVALKKVLAEVLKGRIKNTSDNEKTLIQCGYRKEFCNLAMSEYSEALKYEPSNWRARYFIATDLLNNKKYAQAIVEYNKVIRQKPDYPDSYALLGQAYMETEKYQLAIKMLEKAIDMDPRDHAYYVLGLAYKRVNNWKKVGEIEKKLKERKSIYYNDLINPEY